MAVPVAGSRISGKPILVALAFVVGFLAARLCLQALAVFFAWMNEPTSSAASVIGIQAVLFGVCVAGGIASARFLDASLGRTMRTVFASVHERAGGRAALRWAIRLVTVAYLLTWVFGAPQVQSELERLAVERYKNLEARTHSPEWQAYPYIRTSFAIPMCPGLVLSYHEYQVAGLAGWGGWTVYAWYPGHMRQLAARMTWIS
jgi:hypothetical protein